MTTLKLFDNIGRKTDILPKLGYGLFWLALFVASLGAGQNAQAAIQCDGQITANVVVLDSPTVFNRLGAQNPNWITYALERDVVNKVTKVPCSQTACTAGNVELRPDKRPRPLVIRSVEGACLTVNFTNLLAGPGQGQNMGKHPEGANPNDVQQGPPQGDPGALFNDDQVRGRCAGFHATGTELRNIVNESGDAIGNDGSFVGKNHDGDDVLANCGVGERKGSLVGPNGSITYNLYTPHEGAFIISSYGATLGSEANSGNLAVGMFGALNVQPKGAKIYRSQVTEEEMRLATVGTNPGNCMNPSGEGYWHGVDCDPGGQPIIDYHAVYPNNPPWTDEGKAGLPIISMVCTQEVRANGGSCELGELLHSDINAIIAGPCGDGSWMCTFGNAEGEWEAPYPLEKVGRVNPQLPNRLEAFREYTSQYHDEQTNSQVFPLWYQHPVLNYTLAGVKDQFMINYGSGGIGSEIIANRLHTGNMHDCADCAYEEFFLASQTVGDPAMLVKYPANTGIEACDPTNILSPNCWRQFEDVDNVNGGNPIGANPPIPGNEALFQEDPSNVHHGYTGDFVKIRNTHAGSFEQHIFHLHNHQWLFNPNDDNANYLDAQEIMPGSGHTYELVNGGAGNRNKTVGDAIFHCHFYPHFAQGMWYHIRNLDTFQKGTVLAVTGAEDPQNPAFVPHPGDLKNPYDPDGFGDNEDTLDVDESADDVYPAYHATKWELRRGKPAAGARALPDGELPDGSPIPAVVPLPGRALPQMPAAVSVKAVDRGDFGVLSGRRGPNELLQGPDSAQVVVNLDSVKGADKALGTPDDVSPGFPFWLAGNSCGYVDDGMGGLAEPAEDECPEGIVGQRMPTPVLDMLTEEGADAGGYLKAQAGGWDGGLPRHALRGYTSGALTLDTQNRLDFRKVIKAAPPVFFPELGTPLEQVSMRYQAVRERPSVEPRLNGTVVAGTPEDPVFFVLNGAPPVPGGPFNDPCVDDVGDTSRSGAGNSWYHGEYLGHVNDPAAAGTSPYGADNPRTYRVANIQIDAVFNKVGHHYSQERIIALWGDVEATINKQRPPEPLVMRFNTFDCGKILHANLVPAEFELDDFQVRTPTDIIGQHIHLPKWDLTTGDGAANGWNYEDGTLAPRMVQERIEAINNYNAIAAKAFGATPLLTDLLAAKYPDTLAKLPSDLKIAVAKHTLDTEGLEPVATLPNPCGDKTLDPDDPNTTNACGTIGGLKHLIAQPHPFFGSGHEVHGHNEYDGARTTIQRILVDPVLNVAGVDRGLGLTFSHDHYGPSSFQQIGLYSTILAEPQGSTWHHNETGEDLWGRPITTPGLEVLDGCTVNCTDGGPTSWQAVIDTPEGSPVRDHREFYFEMSDFQHAYEKGVYVAADQFGRPLPEVDIVQNKFADVTSATAPVLQDTWQYAINPPLKTEAMLPDVVTAKGACPGPGIGQGPGGIDQATNFDTDVPRPCAEAINIGHGSTWVINYRNEPVGLRVFDPDKPGPDGQDGAQADGMPGDLALAFQSRGDRVIPALNSSGGVWDDPSNNALPKDGDVLRNEPWIPSDTDPTSDGAPYPEAGYCQSKGDGINCDRAGGDPFTPIMRAYENDLVKVKIQVGATEEQHQATVHGVKWLSNGSGYGRSPNSGWRNFQSTGISEQFSLQVPVIPDRNQKANAVDYLYATDATRDGIWMGTWGILRSYGNARNDLHPLPDNPQDAGISWSNGNDFNGVCPRYQTDEFGNPIPDPEGKGRNAYLPINTVEYTVYAVLANEVLPNNLGVIIPNNQNPVDNAGGPLDPNGGTLIYNRRGTTVPTVDLGADGVFAGGLGPLNDPTAIMYVREEDLVPRFIPGISPDENGDLVDDRCQTVKKGGKWNPNIWTKGCPVKVRNDAPVEPLVLRANAGDCIEVTLHNKLADQAIDREAPKDANGKYTVDPRIFSCDSDNGSGYCGSAFGIEIFDDVLAQKEMGSGKLFARAGDGKIVPYGDIEFDVMPDLAGWQDMMWTVTRRVQGTGVNAEQHYFNNNLIRPSSLAGLHAQLVEYDGSQDDGVVVGQNPQAIVARPAGQHMYRFYAGDISYVDEGVQSVKGKQSRMFRRVATPVEFGASNLLSADRVKQPQKGMFGALVIEPQGATYAIDTDVADGQMGCVWATDNKGDYVRDRLGNPECKLKDGNIVKNPHGTRPTRAQMTVTAPAGYAGSGGTYREALAMGHKVANLRWQDGTAIKNIHQGELGREGAEDSGHAGFNYGMEPSWFRFKLPPNVPFGNAGSGAIDGKTFGSLANVHAFYANGLVANEPDAIKDYPENCRVAVEGQPDDTSACVSLAGDPQTPVFRALADPAGLNPVSDTRMYVLNGASADRDGTFILHGHLWQRDPYVCPLGSQDEFVALTGRCDPDAVASQALGLNPQGKYMGSEEGMGHVFGHWPILFDAGGTDAVTGDYLFRDYAPGGNRNGMFGILRVE